MIIECAYSPCPNDVFIFQAWEKSLIPAPKMKAIYGDIDTLNQWMAEGKYSLTKGSYYCLGKMTQEYQILPVGSALGFGCGPKIISKNPFNAQELHNKTIAIPGKDTTAHLLLSLLCPTPAKKIFCLYHEIADLIVSGKADCGLIIHESRFTYAQQGFHEICDLGEMWEQQYHVPIPLGGIFVKRSLDTPLIDKIIQSISDSLAFAYNNLQTALEETLLHSREKNLNVVKQHIDLYVNSETKKLSDIGRQSIQLLLQLASKKNLIPKFDPNTLFYKEKSCEPVSLNS